MKLLGFVQRVSLVVALLCAISGCDQADAPSTEVPAELSFAEQIAAVERGETTRILVEREVLDDGDLLALVNLTPLTDLLLDNAHSEFRLEGVATLPNVSGLQHLRIRGRGIDDECLGEIAKINRLRILNVPHGSFSDEGLEPLAELPHLESFRFGTPRVTDEGLKTIRRWPAIRMLHLIDVPISDAGLAELAKIERLQSLYIDGGQITDAGWDALFRERPRLHVHVNQEHLDRDPNKHPHSMLPPLPAADGGR